MTNLQQLEKAYRKLSDHTFLDDIENKCFEKYMTVFVVMHQINSNPEHIKIEGIFLDEDRASTIAQLFDFAWVDNYRMYL